MNMYRRKKLGQDMYLNFVNYVKIRTHERLRVPLSNQRKSPRFKLDCKTGDVVFTLQQEKY